MFFIRLYMKEANEKLDEVIRTTATGYYRLTGGIHVVFLSIWAGVVWYSFSTAGFIVASVVFLSFHLVDTVPLFDLRGEGVLETDKPPEAVRGEFEAIVNPLTAVAVAWADEIREGSTNRGGTTAVLEGKLLKLFTREYRLRVDHGDGDSIRILFEKGDDIDATIELSILAQDDATRVAMRSRHGEERILGLLHLFLQNRFEKRVMEHFGYRVVEGSTSVDFRFG